MDEIEVNINKLKVAKVKCLQKLSFHTRYFFMAQYKRKFVLGDHHAIVFDALEQVLLGNIKRLIINIAPRYSKTEVVVKNFVSHCLSLNPSAKFIHLSYSDQLALDNSESIKDVVQSEEYQQLFPNVQIKKDSKAKDKWWTTENGGVLARAAAGQVTGFGAGQVDDPDKDVEEWVNDIERFANEQATTDLDKKYLFGGAIIIDDPIKPEDADSDTIREKVNERFDSTIRNRVNSRETPIIVIMQRLHPNDLAGYLQRTDEADKWTVISLPCINEDDNKFGLPAGEALWPFKHTLEELLKLKQANDIVFERQYMQNPKPKAGLLFPIDDLMFEDMDSLEALQDPDFCYVCADPANLGGDDFAAGPFKLIGDKIYLTDVLYNTEGTDYNEPMVVKMVLQNRAAEVGIESVLGWKETADRIREELTDKGYENEFRLLRPRMSKHSRILNRSSFIRNHFVFRKDWESRPQYAKFIRNLTSYLKIQEAGRSNKRDDAPDLCEMAATYYERNFKHLWGYEKTTK